MSELSWPQRAALQYIHANEGRKGQACRLSRVSESTRQRLIDLGVMEPPLVDTDGDFVRLTAEGCAALEAKGTGK